MSIISLLRLLWKELLLRLLLWKEEVEEEEGEEAAKVESIFIYPIKSCRSISPPEASITSTGFRWDRQWLVVNSSGRGATQRVDPKLALVQVELPPEAFSHGWKARKDSFLEVRAPGMNVLKVPLLEPSTLTDGVGLWGWTGAALDEGEEAAEWFTKFLGQPRRLVRFHEASQNRPAFPKYAAGHKLKFQDAYALLLASQESLDALNERLEEPVQITRFRPNIVVNGCASFAEDLWKKVKINGLKFNSTQLCERCKVPRINQETAELGSEPTQTMRKFRSTEILNPDKKSDGKVYFGHWFICDDHNAKAKSKTIKVGDPVYVLKKLSSYEDVVF
ncbi:unnamed protein product [Cuscuta epithymum]|uniref:MOSC domain-containing protein n=1 Tax=Cuscuta epithymum TaxID=186058 RepID=A0AAV0EA13_9ASTE|nr:unnamed protein product [Cuscuta epithymum]CAH9141293.1 unnamed protein product [Cuscuta epithymum]